MDGGCGDYNWNWNFEKQVRVTTRWEVGGTKAPHATMSLLRCSNVGRHALLNSRRSFTASAFVKSESAPVPNVGSVKPPKQPIGGFRGGYVLLPPTHNFLVITLYHRLQDCRVSSWILTSIFVCGLSLIRRI